MLSGLLKRKPQNIPQKHTENREHPSSNEKLPKTERPRGSLCTNGFPLKLLPEKRNSMVSVWKQFLGGLRHLEITSEITFTFQAKFSRYTARTLVTNCNSKPRANFPRPGIKTSRAKGCFPFPVTVVTVRELRDYLAERKTGSD